MEALKGFEQLRERARGVGPRPVAVVDARSESALRAIAAAAIEGRITDIRDYV